MKYIGRISDIDIGEEEKGNENNPNVRVAVRAILINDNNKIAILHKKNKNEYKLIGGGVDNGENYENALKREALEESGCKIKILAELGYIEEFRSKMNFKQISYVYVTKVIEDTQILHLTQKEKEEGAEICWFEPAEAYKKMEEAYKNAKPSKYSNLYSTKIIIKRDMHILNKYLEYMK